MASADHKPLVAWQKSMVLVERVYRVTACFPPEEIYGLSNQLRRAAVSIPSNIAEGQGRDGRVEFDRFLRIASGSRQEVETPLIIATRLGYLNDSKLDVMVEMVEEIGRIIAGLRRSLQKR
jgi:four helix bundle protein